ncbi:MAG: polyprenyl diphosphate synthase [Longimicrobiales bacterium]
MTDNGLHVGIIMDGNGRWAQRRGMPRPAGHAAGAQAARAVVEAAADSEHRIGWLTLYAFSSDNWLRPTDEVDALMALFHEYLEEETPRCIENGIRMRVVGRRDRLSKSLVERIEATESATAHGREMTLRLAVDYSARDAIVRAAERALRAECDGAADPAPSLCRDRFRALLGEAVGCNGPARDVDLLIRTGGEQRLSDFMLWECAYAELYFTPVLWPDFGPGELAEALAEFNRRERRFGRVLKEAV